MKKYNSKINSFFFYLSVLFLLTYCDKGEEDNEDNKDNTENISQETEQKSINNSNLITKNKSKNIIENDDIDIDNITDISKIDEIKPKIENLLSEINSLKERLKKYSNYSIEEKEKFEADYSNMYTKYQKIFIELMLNSIFKKIINLIKQKKPILELKKDYELLKKNANEEQFGAFSKEANIISSSISDLDHESMIKDESLRVKIEKFHKEDKIGQYINDKLKKIIQENYADENDQKEIFDLFSAKESHSEVHVTKNKSTNIIEVDNSNRNKINSSIISKINELKPEIDSLQERLKNYSDLTIEEKNKFKNDYLELYKKFNNKQIKLILNSTFIEQTIKLIKQKKSISDFKSEFIKLKENSGEDESSEESDKLRDELSNLEEKVSKKMEIKSEIDEIDRKANERIHSKINKVIEENYENIEDQNKIKNLFGPKNVSSNSREKIISVWREANNIEAPFAMSFLSESERKIKVKNEIDKYYDKAKKIFKNEIFLDKAKKNNEKTAKEEIRQNIPIYGGLIKTYNLLIKNNYDPNLFMKIPNTETLELFQNGKSVYDNDDLRIEYIYKHWDKFQL